MHAGVGERAFRPCAGIDIGSARAVVQKVHRHHRKLQRCAALQKQRAEFLRRLKNFQRQFARLLGDFLKVPAAVRHLYQRHAGAVVVDEFFLRLLQGFQRQGAGTRAEVVFAIVHSVGFVGKGKGDAANGAGKSVIHAMQQFAARERGDHAQHAVGDRVLRLLGGGADVVGAADIRVGRE